MDIRTWSDAGLKLELALQKAIEQAGLKGYSHTLNAPGVRKPHVVIVSNVAHLKAAKKAYPKSTILLLTPETVDKKTKDALRKKGASDALPCPNLNDEKNVAFFLLAIEAYEK